MPELEAIEKQLFTITADGFNALALKIFYFQYRNNPVYKQFVDYLSIKPESVKSIHQIPFMPVEFFKDYEISSGGFEAELVFRSSGTTGTQTSTHFVRKRRLYEQSFTECFSLFFGPPKDLVILALLPSYLEREDSSLVYMANKLIQLTADADSGFYLHDLERLSQTLNRLKQQQKKTLLIGVTYALLDLAAQYPMAFPGLILMETGGMKGQRKEMVRSDLHQQLQQAFGITSVCSEYGMTELLSQAYSKGGGRFFTPPWMKVLIRDINDPLNYVGEGKTGGLNIIDLANLHSCSFLATKDLGKLYTDSSFEVLGRFDSSDIRGCNLMLD